MAQQKTRSIQYPRGGKPSVTQTKPSAPNPPHKSHKLKNTLLALTGAGILGLGGYALLSDANDTPAATPPTPATPAHSVKPAAVKKGFPAFNPKPAQMDSEFLKAYTDLRGPVIDPRMDTEKFGENPLFLGIRQDLYNRMFANLKSGQYKTVNSALQDALNKQFSTFKHVLHNRQVREYNMVVALPVDNTRVGFNMVDVANQIMTYKMAEQNKKWVHATRLTPEMRDNTAIFLGRAQSALTVTAANFLEGYTPEQAAKVMELFGPRILDVDLLANAQHAQQQETAPQPGLIGEAWAYFSPNLDAHQRYINTLELTKEQIERGVNAFDAAVFATNEYKSSSTSAAQDNKSDSFVYRFGALSDVLKGTTTKQEQIQALKGAIEHPNILARTKDNTPLPWNAFGFAAVVAIGIGATRKWVNKIKEMKANEISPEPKHDNPVVRKWYRGQRGLKK